jgi:hypothetical protein
MPKCMGEGLLAFIGKIYHDDEELQAQAIAEASCYKNRERLFAKGAVFKAASRMPGAVRWSQADVLLHSP